MTCRVRIVEALHPHPAVLRTATLPFQGGIRRGAAAIPDCASLYPGYGPSHAFGSSISVLTPSTAS